MVDDLGRSGEEIVDSSWDDKSGDGYFDVDRGEVASSGCGHREYEEHCAFEARILATGVR